MAAFSGRNPPCTLIHALLVLMALLIMVPPASAADPFTDTANWEHFNLTSSLNATLKGFSGVVHSGDFLYYIPYYSTGSVSHGNAARYDSRGSFTDPSSWESFNLTTLNGTLKGFNGGVANGGYVYFVPYYNGVTYSGTVARFDTSGPFASPASWSSFNMTSVNATMAGYRGAVAKGNFLYFVPYQRASGFHGEVARYDTTQPFTSPSAWSSFNLTIINATLKGYQGGVVSGNHVYLIPVQSGSPHGYAVRYDTTRSFTDPASWESFNITSLNASLCGFIGGMAGGNHMYYVPFANNDGFQGNVVRYDTTRSFTAPSSWESYDLETLDPALTGFLGGMARGNYVYFVPYFSSVGIGTTAARYNTTLPFTSPSSWAFFDVSTVDPSLGYFYGGGVGGDSLYYTPFRLGDSGVAARYRDVTSPTASFTGAPVSGTATLAVAFTDASTGSPTAWSWDFGDGGTSAVQHPSHSYGSAGTYTVSLTVTNPWGSDTMTRTGYVTVSAPSAQTGSSGGSATIGATSAAAASRVSPGEVVTFTFPNPTMPIRSVTFTSRSAATEVLVTAIERSIPAGTPPPNITVYRFIDIQTYHLPEDSVTSAVITFQVPRSWISSLDADPRQVVLLRYYADAWQELPTEYLEAGNGYLQYRSRTPGFSLFAIGLNLSQGQPESPVTATTVPTRMHGVTPTPPVSSRSTPAPSESEPPSPDGSLFHTAILIGAVAVLVAAVLAWRYSLPRPLGRNRDRWL